VRRGYPLNINPGSFSTLIAAVLGSEESAQQISCASDRSSYGLVRLKALTS
jgi:hypothetical protein